MTGPDAEGGAVGEAAGQTGTAAGGLGDGPARKPVPEPAPWPPSSGAAGVETLGYEQARAELADVVARLEAGGLSLEEALAMWERGERLADVCQAWLDGARQRLDTALRGEQQAGTS
jgi:exodeoxyribonuclease VII small subunit